MHTVLYSISCMRHLTHTRTVVSWEYGLRRGLDELEEETSLPLGVSWRDVEDDERELSGSWLMLEHDMDELRLTLSARPTALPPPTPPPPPEAADDPVVEDEDDEEDDEDEDDDEDDDEEEEQV